MFELQSKANISAFFFFTVFHYTLVCRWSSDIATKEETLKSVNRWLKIHSQVYMFGLAVEHFLSFWEKYRTMLRRVSGIMIGRNQDVGTKRKTFSPSLPFSFPFFSLALLLLFHHPVRTHKKHSFDTSGLWNPARGRDVSVPVVHTVSIRLHTSNRATSCLRELCKEGSVDFTGSSVPCRTKDRSFVVKGKTVQWTLA